ncbi:MULTISPECIES: radical SAM/SPASM domain-containing protein [Frankia]|uniref:Uncharacterized protein n=1 Tax=Frankia alni (strain DSM 45986 / CECT 9034 / ACN14a) TaxID=326424 RepID=Q0RLM0_FRAAA|nr:MULTISPECIES: radical SAM protein [Frankia]CAJ61584.1 hypothetical protein FRAAL2940 [Frankia alni ACN14a]
MPPTATLTRTDLLWLVLTGRCQLACGHCYAESGPTGTHGTMTNADWQRVIDDAAASGVRRLKFIGGEPTLHPALPDLVGHALTVGVEVEIFTNLVHVPDRLWPVFTRPGVSLATSYYTTDATEHDGITGRRGSHARTRRNIVAALRRGIPLRVAITGEGDSADRAHAELLALGVPTITRDRVRAVGRAAPAGAVPDPGELCGRCGHGRAAVQPDGTLTPCIMSSGLDGGNVKRAPLAELLAGQRWRDAVSSVPRTRTAVDGCTPDDSNDCGPSGETACQPDYDS